MKKEGLEQLDQYCAGLGLDMGYNANYLSFPLKHTLLNVG